MSPQQHVEPPQHEHVRQQKFGEVLLCLGMAFGVKFPDIDQHLRALGCIQHRSILTHGFLLPVLCALLWRHRWPWWVRPLLIGICATVAVHLSFDLFPRAWRGGALIHIPWYGWTAPWFSLLWLLASVVICVYLGGTLIQTFVEIFLALGGMSAYLVFASEPLFWPLCTLLFGLGVVWLVEKHLAHIITRDQYFWRS